MALFTIKGLWRQRLKGSQNLSGIGVARIRTFPFRRLRSGENQIVGVGSEVEG